MRPPGLYSINSLTVTQMMDEERSSDGLTSLVLAHELGHSFHASHDDDWRGKHDCVPGKKSRHGNYLMSAFVVTNPHKAHNWMFSQCSRKAMAQVIADDSTTWCFKARSSSYCGNAVVEPVSYTHLTLPTIYSV